MDVVNRAVAIYREQGLLRVLKQIIPYTYENTIRPYLPSSGTPRVFNEVKIPGGKILDPYIPFFQLGEDIYEEEIIEGLSAAVESGDSVVIIGGGWGVSAVKAAELVGEGGRVIVYEAAEEYVNYIKKTLHMNDVSGIVDVRHGVVGDPINVYSDLGSAEKIPPDSLPDCDHLVLDCEGAETFILSEMVIRPRNLIVETHGQYGAPKDEVENKLRSAGYKIIDESPMWEARGIYILIATLNPELM